MNAVEEGSPMAVFMSSLIAEETAADWYAIPYKKKQV